MQRMLRVGLLPALLLSCLSIGQVEAQIRRAPGFSLPDVSMKQYDLHDYRGRVVVLDIMQTSCPHCQTLARALERVKAKYGDKVAVLSVVNPPDNLNTVRQYQQKYGIRTPVLFDMGQMAVSYLRVTPQNPGITLPHLFVIDKAGMIRHDMAYSEGQKSLFEEAGLSNMIEPLLK